MNDADTRYRLSEHLRFLAMDDQVLVAHPFRMTRALLRREIEAVLLLFRDESLTLEELGARVDAERELLETIFDLFRGRSFIVPADEAEDDALIQSYHDWTGDSADALTDLSDDHFYHYPSALGFSELAGRSARDARGGDVALRPLRVVVLGGCFSQFASDSITERALIDGFDAQVRSGWPSEPELIQHFDPEVVVLQPSTTYLTRPLWDDYAFLAPGERRDRLDSMGQALEITIDEVAERCEGRLLLVHGFTVPQQLPGGRSDFRNEISFDRIVFELNSRICRRLEANPNALYIDEERIAANFGKSRLLDDRIAPYSHHAPIDFEAVTGGLRFEGPSREESFGVAQRLHLPRLLADEYLQCFKLWSGLGRVKCIVCDLDNTLWHGVVGDEGMRLDPEALQDFRFGVTGGIHQALKILKERGVLLATCSKNDESVALAEWRKLAELAAEEGLNHVLGPDDFVLHQINWRRKSENIGQICDALGFAPEALLFIDDNPVERAEVRNAYPSIRVLGADMNLVRGSLLGDATLELNIPSAESALRSEMVKGQLAREQARAELSDEAGFLRSLEIGLSVTRVRDRRWLARIVELVQRTNQYNTTLIRYDADAIGALIDSEDGAVYVLHARDRFTHYGLVGVCVLESAEVANLVLSCRVIGLAAGPPFLGAVVEHWGRTPLRGRIVDAPRNAPCRGLFDEVGFSATGDGCFELESGDALAPIDASIYAIEVVDAADAPDGGGA